MILERSVSDLYGANAKNRPAGSKAATAEATLFEWSVLDDELTTSVSLDLMLSGSRTKWYLGILIAARVPITQWPDDPRHGPRGALAHP
jgi:hypothetical protein